MKATHIYQAPQISAPFANNDNSTRARMETILLMIAMNYHELAWNEVVKLSRISEEYKRLGIKHHLIDRRLVIAREIEQQLRNDLLRCPTKDIKNAAAKVVHLRRTFQQEDATKRGE
jgi:hypothetical protein